MISSVHNPRVQWVRELQAKPRARRQAGLCVVEGVRLVEEAQAWHEHGEQPAAEQVFYTAEVSERGQALVQNCLAQGVQVEEVAAHVMSAMCETHTPQGILAVVRIPRYLQPAALDFTLILDGMRDPGNLGSVLRTAAAAGVDAVLLPPETVDPYAPKVLRSGMGAHFHLRIFELSWEEIRRVVAAHRLSVYLAAARQGTVYTQADLRQPLALVIGGEAAGAGDEIQGLGPSSIHIPMPGGSESLNAAAAAAAILFEVVRQRMSVER